MTTTKWANPLQIPVALKRMLGQPADPNLDAWTALITALRDSTQASRDAMVKSYLGLKKVREDLGLPFMSGTGGEGGAVDPGAWGPDLDQQAVDLVAMGKIAVDGASDVLANKRKLIYSNQLQDFVVEALPTDAMRVGVVGGKPVLLDATSGNTAHGSGTVGILPLLIAGGIVGNGLIALAAYGIVKESFALASTVSTNKMLRTLSNNQTELVTSGKATPEQAAAQTKALLDGAESVKLAAAAEKNAGAPAVNDYTKLIATVGIIGLVGFGLYLVGSSMSMKRALASATP